MGDSTASAVDVCLRRLFEVYTGLRRRWIPNYHGPGDRYSDKWRKMAEVLTAAEADPAAYVRFVFDLIGKSQGDVFVEQVTSPKYVQMYIDSRPAIVARLAMLVSLQIETVRFRTARGDLLEGILSDRDAEFSAVFRYALASRAGLWQVASEFRNEAEQMLCLEPAYRELLARWLPEGACRQDR